MDMFQAVFCILTSLCLLLLWLTQSKAGTSTDESVKQLQRSYMIVYILAMAGDWLQGPHVYALYQSYGMTTQQINLLFVMGFASSMIVGTVIGSVADMYGRRANCILYGILYSLSCATKHVPSFWVLLIGRFLGGTATSILFSAFESWLVCEYHKRGCAVDQLGIIFSNATLGNSIVAILAGFVAEFFADMFGFVAPFDVSLCVLMVMIGVILKTWNENYGDQEANLKSSFHGAIQAIRSDAKVFYLGLIQSLFEGAMYTFVLEWTPALTPVNLSGNTQKIPHGVIFASFMVAVMIGSAIFKLFLRLSQPQSFMRFVFVLSAISLAVPVILSQNQILVFCAFVMFEVCVGIFWPAMGTMRGNYIPEKSRATVMNCFRIPLNLVVICILVQDLSRTVIFQCCVVFLLLAAVCQHALYSLEQKTTEKSSSHMTV